jgi:hypothetical protein
MKMASLPIPENTRKTAVFSRNGWQLCTGTGGNFQPEWVAVLLRNMHVVIETEDPYHHRIAIPDHKVLRIGTLNAIAKAVAQHKGK